MVSNMATVTNNHQYEIAYRWLSVDFFIHALLSRAYLCVSWAFLFIKTEEKTIRR